MALSKEDIKAIVRENRGGTWYDAYGPSQLGGMDVWEAWVTKESEFENRFVLDGPGRPPQYFDSFQTFAPHFEKIHQNAVGTGMDQKAAIHLMKLKAYVAALVFVIAALAMLYIAGTQGGSTIISGVVGIVASGSAYFFGRWVPQ